jgi:diaminopimelate epimerase
LTDVYKLYRQKKFSFNHRGERCAQGSKRWFAAGRRGSGRLSSLLSCHCRQANAKIHPMKIPFARMHGAGNDFVVLNETAGPLNLSGAQFRFLAHRHFGVGADQILIVGAAPSPNPNSVDFSYRIVNADGAEVEHCGNGARCFVRYVRELGLSSKTTIRVQTVNQVLTLTEQADGGVTVNMGQPVFGAEAVHFDAQGLATEAAGGLVLYGLPGVEKYEENGHFPSKNIASIATFSIATVSMGNPHAVLQVADVDALDLPQLGPQIQSHPRFAQGVNAGFMQVRSRSDIALRVFERGVGETLACGTGACAAVAAGVVQGLLDASVRVATRGGELRVDWAGPGHDLLMTGPAVFLFQSEIELPAQFEG